MGREVYPELTGTEARRRIAGERAAAEAEREAEEAFAAAVTRREEASIIRAIGPVFRGNSAAEAAKAEQRRVRGLIERDRALRIADALRAEATIEVADGVMANLADTVVPPTPEWLARNAGAVENYTPRQPDGTVRTVSTYRVMRVPGVIRMARKGQISDDAAKACLRYATCYEQTGLDATIACVDLQREVFGGWNTRLMFTDFQQNAQDEWRRIRNFIPARDRKFFDAVVINGVPVHRAAPLAKTRRSNAVPKFRELAENLACAMGDLKTFD